MLSERCLFCAERRASTRTHGRTYVHGPLWIVRRAFGIWVLHYPLGYNSLGSFEYYSTKSGTFFLVPVRDRITKKREKKPSHKMLLLKASFPVTCTSRCF